MDKRTNRVKVFFSEEDLKRINLFIAVNNIHTNVSLMARASLRKKFDNRKIELSDIPSNGDRVHEMLILFNDNEKNLIHELAIHNDMSNSKVVRILVLTFLRG